MKQPCSIECVFREKITEIENEIMKMYTGTKYSSTEKGEIKLEEMSLLRTLEER